MRLQAFHCPCCGAPVEIPAGAARVTCGYCNGSLFVDHERVTHRAPPPPRKAEEDHPPYAQPDATLFTREAKRFELSMIEQKVPERPGDVFTSIELGDDRFALVYLRAVDVDGKPVEVPLAPGFEALRESLEADGDPGLAANLALDALCAKGFTHRLECAVLLFEPRHMRVTPYSAGCRDSIIWVSGEEGRAIVPGLYHDALERKMLRESRDHFSNGQFIHLAAHDLVVMTSAGFAGRGDRASDSGRSLFDTLNGHLGEEPLRIVTLAKNAFWEHRRGSWAAEPPAGNIAVAAVRAVLPEAVRGLPAGLASEVVRTKKFEVAMLCGRGDAVKLLPLFSDRHVVVWLSAAEGSVSGNQMDAACEAVLGVLNRKDHGDNENPRCAGREAYEAMRTTPEQVRMAVIQLFDEWERVKYFRAGWKQPLLLGGRGVDSDGQQQFDEGGEATVHLGARLFFPGALDYEGQHGRADSFAEVWHGGKASLLYEALANHWKTKKSDKALEKLALAACGDLPGAVLSGLAVVSGI